MKAMLEIVNIDANDIVTVSEEIASCSNPGQLVECGEDCPMD